MDNPNQLVDTAASISGDPKIIGKQNFDMWDDMDTVTITTPPNRIKARHDMIKARISSFQAKVKGVFIHISLRFYIPFLIMRLIIYGYVIYLMFK